MTVQLGNGAALAGRLGIPVVYDFRAADVAAGGQGAPIVPVFHRAMVAALKRPYPVGVLNLGGVANVTFIDDNDDFCAFDTGPGNALIDDFVRLRTGQPRDDQGRAAGAGQVDEAAIERVLAHPFFARRPPKSLDRNAFRQWVAEAGRLTAKSTEDGAATLTAITAAAVAHALKVLPRAPKGWIVAGGGTRNPTLMRMLAERLAPAPVETAGAVGWSADALEAQAFAYLAVRTLKGLPITFPTTTGVPRPLIADDALDTFHYPRQALGVDLVRRVARPMVVGIAERRGVRDHQRLEALLGEGPMIGPADARHDIRRHPADRRKGGMRAK
jgi:anhydro-N-acetylmuramic acid kinase